MAALSHGARRNETEGLICSEVDFNFGMLRKKTSQTGNEHTSKTLLVGSEWIYRFGISAVDERGNKLDAVETRKKLDKDRRTLIEEARKRRVNRALVALAHTDEGEFKIASFIDYLQDRGAFTPLQLPPFDGGSIFCTSCTIRATSRW